MDRRKFVFKSMVYSAGVLGLSLALNPKARTEELDGQIWMFETEGAFLPFLEHHHEVNIPVRHFLALPHEPVQLQTDVVTFGEDLSDGRFKRVLDATIDKLHVKPHFHSFEMQPQHFVDLVEGREIEMKAGPHDFIVQLSPEQMDWIAAQQA